MNQVLSQVEQAQWQLGRDLFAQAGMCAAPPPAKPAKAVPADPLSPSYSGFFNCRPRNAKNGAQSTYSGALVTTLLDKELVSSILPASLTLATPDDPTTPTHPVIFLLGVQDIPCQLRGGAPKPLPTDPYTELILLIPYTVKVGGAGEWHSYSARMYLDNLGAIAIGNSVYAYSKEWGDFDPMGTRTEVRHSGNTYFETDIVETGAWIKVTNAPELAGCVNALQILQMPIVGRNFLLGSVCSYFEWDLSAAEVAPASSEHRFVQAFCPGMQDWVALDFLTSAPSGAFKIRNVQWRLSTDLPFPAC